MTARDYAKVLPSFWTGTTGKAIRALGSDCQVVALYLMTSPHASAIGLYHLPLAYLCADTGSPLEGARKALRSLSEVSFCHYDEPSETVWIPEMARHQVGESVKASDNRRSWLVKEVERMRKRPFFNDFLEKYGAAFSLGLVPEPKPLGSPLEAPSEALRSQEQEKEQEQETERERESAPARPAFGWSDITETFSRLRSEAWQARSGRPGGRWKPGTKDHGGISSALELFRDEPEPMAALEDSIRGFLVDPWCIERDWPFSAWANDPGKYRGKASSGSWKARDGGDPSLDGGTGKKSILEALRARHDEELLAAERCALRGDADGKARHTSEAARLRAEWKSAARSQAVAS